MLNLTEGAAEAIRGLVGDRPDAGLRIFSRKDDGNQIELGLSISDRPETGDEVVDHSGTHVFVDAQIAPILDGRTLDANVGDGQRVQFGFVS
ncbi:MAG TPA: hypothetical protein VNF71_14010 [Acidimicrobiales bacterium]|nr:hypothetical protein [Acidimicrobiales bacterium]